MVARGFILNRIGRGGNTLKIRPPLPFSVENADMLMDALRDTLATLPVVT
jgi:4-aminobutyrate aminotransferase-like enzyme